MKRSERRVPYYRYDHIIKLMVKYPILQVAMLLICTAIGVFGFILPSIRDYVPIAREDALTYTGYFEAYDSMDAKIRFSDGARYSFDPHTVPKALEDALEATEKGTELSLAVNPRANVVIEVMRGTEELLNFETSQITIQKYHRGYIWIGALLTGGGIIFVVLLNLLIRTKKRAKKKEADRILENIDERAKVCTLEIKGKNFSSEEFAKFIEKQGVEGINHIQFIIGGSLGLHERVLRKSQMAISFSAMTFPHQMMRVILLEQIYRAFRILNGEPYHK